VVTRIFQSNYYNLESSSFFHSSAIFTIVEKALACLDISISSIISIAILFSSIFEKILRLSTDILIEKILG